MGLLVLVLLAAHTLQTSLVSSISLARRNRHGLRTFLATSEVDVPVVDETIPHVVIVGGGWGGYGAAHALADSVDSGALRVTLLEAGKQGGGLASGWKTPQGRPIEAGIHGFWRCYRNIDALVAELGLVGERSPFTDYCESSLFTTSGESVVAPVLGDSKLRLPAPLGTALIPKFGTLSLLERATAAALLLPWLDFDGSERAWKRWDDMTAHTLLTAPGLSPRLYAEFLEPLLLVLPMAPGFDVSAAGALSCFSFFALEHQADFDVRWLRGGSATECLFEPWRAALEAKGVKVLNGQKVESFELSGEGENGSVGGSGVSVSSSSSSTSRVTAVTIQGKTGTGSGDGGGDGGGDGDEGSAPNKIRCDAVISGISISATQALLRNGKNARLARLPEFARITKLRSVACVAVRLWLSAKLPVPPTTPSNVVGGNLLPDLENIGFTFYHLNDLQTSLRDSPGQASVVEVDFYGAAPLLSRTDADLVALTVAALRKACPASFRVLEVSPGGAGNSGSSSGGGGGGGSGVGDGPGSRKGNGGQAATSVVSVEDFAVVRVPNAVTHFAPGSFKNMPPIQPEALDNFCFCGDWVDRGGHRSWSQEKALVTGYQAAAATLARLSKVERGSSRSSGSKRAAATTTTTRATRQFAAPTKVLDVEEDEPHVAAGRAAVGALRNAPLPEHLR